MLRGLQVPAWGWLVLVMLLLVGPLFYVGLSGAYMKRNRERYYRLKAILSDVSHPSASKKQHVETLWDCKKDMSEREKYHEERERTMLDAMAALLAAKVTHKSENAIAAKNRREEIPEQLYYYYRVVADRPWIGTVCEVGFNAGQSFLAFLMANSAIRYISWTNNNGNLPWSDAMADFVNYTFPSHMTFIKGDHSQTVPRFRAEEEAFTGCDVIIADERHEGEAPYEDLNNLIALAKTGAVVLLDDLMKQYADVKLTWERIIGIENKVRELECIAPLGFVDRNWCRGLVIKGGYPAHPKNEELGLLPVIKS